MQEATATDKYRKRYSQLRDDAAEWRSHWSDISDYMLPRKGRYLSSDNNTRSTNGSKKHQKIINGSASGALRTLAAGMQGGLTSPSRPWFVLTLPDQELMEYSPVKRWLHDVRNIMFNIFAKSNFYGTTHGMYKELGAFGVASALIEEDFRSIIRCRPFTIGEFVLAVDPTYRPDTLYRRFDMSSDQMVREFGIENVTDAVKTALANNNKDLYFEVMHAIQPNLDKKGKTRDMAYESIYFQEGGDPNKFLRKGGYKNRPFIAPRWDVTGTDVYGDGPAMEALGDVKMLQKMEEKKLKALDKMVDPPVNMPASMRGKGGTIIAGGVNYYDDALGPASIAPTMQVRADIQSIAYEVERVEQRVRRFFFNDLFLMIANEGKNMTATEVSKRHEEKLMMLGPVIERLQSEQLDPIIERTYNIANDLGLFPPMPEELQDVDVKIEYISLLAQAQKMIATTSIEQTAAFVGNLAGVDPGVVDKMNFDEAVDQYAELVGVPPKVVRSDDEVSQIREQRAAEQERAAAAERGMQSAQGAKLLSETNANGQNMLEIMQEGL